MLRATKVVPFIGFAAQAKPALLESAGASALHTLAFGFYPGDAAGTQGMGVSRCSIYYPGLVYTYSNYR